jgi:hypothetical protein
MSNNDQSSATAITGFSAVCVSGPFLVDAHDPVWTRDRPMPAGSAHCFEHDFSVVQCLRRLDDHGIVRGFLAAASAFGDHNDGTIGALRSNHQRLRGSVIVDPDINRQVPERRVVDSVVGLRLPLHVMADCPTRARSPIASYFAVSATSTGMCMCMCMSMGRGFPASSSRSRTPA